jgi:hypothetical protein
MMNNQTFKSIKIGDKVRKDGTKTIRTVQAVNDYGMFRTVILVMKGGQINAIQNTSTATTIPSFYHNWHIVED